MIDSAQLRPPFAYFGGKTVLARRIIWCNRPLHDGRLFDWSGGPIVDREGGS